MSITFSLVQPGSLPGGLDVAGILVIAFVIGGVGLVFWASKPSVIARYSADLRNGAGEPPLDGAPSSGREPPEGSP